MDEITMFAELRPQAPDDADLNEMRSEARRRVAAAARPRARWRRPALAAGLTAAVAGGAAAAVVLASGGTPAPVTHLSNVVTAAWTVRQNANGTVTVTIKMHQFAHPAQLQRVLRDDGINAYVRQLQFKKVRHDNTTVFTFRCLYARTNYASAAVQKAVVSAVLPRGGWTINPAAMPAGSALFLVGGPIAFPGLDGVIEASQPVVLNSDKLPACVPFTLPPP